MRLNSKGFFVLDLLNTKSIFLLCSLLSLTIGLSAQDLQRYGNLIPKISPLAPESGSIAKYGEYEVSLFTGLPQIQIPIYTITVGEMTVPISISYHASGIKVNETASWVGTGWSLSAGSSISRQVQGIPDERVGAYLSNSQPIRLASAINPTEPNSGGLDYLRTVNRGTADGEPDVFSYNIQGRGGKFLFNYMDNFAPILIPYSPILINRTSTGTNSMSLNIKDANGIKYNFEDVESYQPSSGLPYATSWLVTNMTSANGSDIIQFNYTSLSGRQQDVTDIETVGDELRDDPANANSGGYSFLNSGNHTVFSNTVTSLISEKQVKEIIFKGGKVVFNSGEDRLDRTYDLDTHKRLASIGIYYYDYPTQTYHILKTINLIQSYFIKNNDAETRRLRLDALQILDDQNNIIQQYGFDYNNSVLLPSKMSRSRDYWGYYNGVANTTLVPGTDINVINGGSLPFHIGGANMGRDANPAFMQAEILTKVTYPTGGNSQFEYETNKYSDGQSNIKYAGGLRIRSIKNYDGINPNPVVKTYKYGLNEDGLGRANFVLDRYFYMTEQTIKYFYGQTNLNCPFMAKKRVRTFLANSTIGLDGAEGSPVVYPVVTEYEGDETNNQGKTIYTFRDEADAIATSSYLGTAPKVFSRQFARGQLLSKTVYRRATVDSYKKVQTVENSYEAFPRLMVDNIGLAVAKKVDNTGSVNNAYLGDLSSMGTTGCSDFNDSYSYAYMNYSIATGDNSLVQSVETIYDPDDENKAVGNTTNYTYAASHLQPVKIEKTNSKNGTITTFKKYPVDYPTILPYQNMVIPAVHIIDKVVEETTVKDISTPISVRRNNYYYWGSGNYLPQTVEIKKGIAASEVRLRYHSYDTKGNVLSLSNENGPKTSYKWGYNSQYPIAEVKNSAANEFYSQDFEEPDLGLDFESNVSYDKIKSHTGIYSGKLVNPNATELVSHSSKGLTVSLAVGKKFSYSGWIYSTGPSAQLFLFMMKSGETGYFSYVDAVGTDMVNKWVYLKGEFLVPADVTLLKLRLDNNSAGTVWFDDLRILPSDASMSTYTYAPLVGMTSTIDNKGQTVYYEYDSFQRLKYIRNQDSDIIKSYDYNYKP